MLKANYRRKFFLGFVLSAALMSGCVHRVLAPPSVDLQPYGRIGIFHFSTLAKGNLGRFATEKFIESVQSSQPGTPVMELGILDKVPDPQFLKQIKEKFGVGAVIVGNLDLSKVTPSASIDLSTFVSSMNVRANVEARLLVKLYETEHGASLWTRTAHARESVAQVWLSRDGALSFDASDPEASYGRLVHALVQTSTYDLRPHYVRGG